MRLIFYFIFIFSFFYSSYSFAECNKNLTLQVLGSGGPIADDNRASSGYLLWIDNKARLLVDTGGGVMLRFAQSGADFEDLDAIVLTHLHADHSADLPALLKSSYFSDRTEPLKIYGPTGRNQWPSTTEFITGLFDPKVGIYRYLSEFVDGSGKYQIDARDVDSVSKDPLLLFQNEDLTLTAVGVHHGPVPAIAVLIETQNKRIAISGDQSNHNPVFAKLIQDADLLIMAHAIPDNAGRIAKKLHATPRYIGQLAANASIKQLVLSHLMSRSINVLEKSKQSIQENFFGTLSVAQDLACYHP